MRSREVSTAEGFAKYGFLTGGALPAECRRKESNRKPLS